MNLYFKLIPLSLLSLCLYFPSLAQDAGSYESTALDLSRTYQGGTARMQGIGGVQTSLGGDMSSASSNPAGLGFFNRSEFSFSPTLNFVNTSSTYMNSQVNDSKLNLNFANLGVVLNKSKSNIIEDKWRGGSFGISINRIADFQSKFTYEGYSFNPTDGDGNLILDANTPKDFIEYAVLSGGVSGGEVNFNDNPFVELAYETYLIDAFPDENDVLFLDRDVYVTDANGNVILDNGSVIPAFPEEEYPTRQLETVNSRGGAYQTSFAYGGNYADRLYFGASIGILSMNRDVERIYTEQPTQTTLESLTLIDSYNISGIGVNATVGMIARPVTPLLVGVSYTTPSTYAIEQTQELTLQADYTSSTNYRSDFEEWTITYVPFDYNITTPSRLNAGLTYFIGKSGFISGDVERVSYNGARLANGDGGYTFADENTIINRYNSVFNYRIGGELRLDKFRFRAGYNYQGDPTDDNVDNSISRISLGAGIRTKNTFFDLGIVNATKETSSISPYPGASIAEIERSNTTATFSVGFFF